jgi:hypothetical protein
VVRRPVDVILARDWNGMNSGAVMYRRSAYTLHLLRRMWTVDAKTAAPWWDQGALRYMMVTPTSAAPNEVSQRALRHPLDVRSDRMHMWVLKRSRYRFNTYPVGIVRRNLPVSYEPGDFFVHVVGCRFHPHCPQWLDALFNESICSNAAAHRPFGLPLPPSPLLPRERVARALMENMSLAGTPRALVAARDGASFGFTPTPPPPFHLDLLIPAAPRLLRGTRDFLVNQWAKINAGIDRPTAAEAEAQLPTPQLDAALHAGGYTQVPYSFIP